MADWVIGDLHGCLDEFDALLQLIRFDPSADTLWLTGDLINRGPKCLETLRYVHTLHQEMGARLQIVLGNHDVHLLTCWAGVRTPGRTDTLASILAASDANSLCNWLRTQPFLHEQGSHILVHAGLHPSLSLSQHRALANGLHGGLSGSDPRPTLQAIYGEQQPGFAAAVLTRMRCLNADLSLNLQEKGAPDNLPDGVMPWYTLAAHRFADAQIHTGHWAALGYGVYGPVVALDGGCVWGGDLVAVRRDAPARPYRISRGAG